MTIIRYCHHSLELVPFDKTFDIVQDFIGTYCVVRYFGQQPRFVQNPTNRRAVTFKIIACIEKKSENVAI